MNTAEMIVTIVLVVMVARVLRTYFETRARTAPHDAAGAAEAAMLRREVQTLKERIQVLERLATDDNDTRRLDREIEALRDRK